MDVTLVTGASAGIGQALATECAKDGRDLVLIARGEARLREVGKSLATRYGITAHPIAMDLAAPEAPEALVAAVREKGYRVEMLINNAAAFSRSAFVNTDLGTLKEMLQLNVVNLTLCTHLFLDEMLQANRGYLINVSSLAALQAIPNLACYAASKAYVLSFSEALAMELSHTGIKVCALCPGLTDTEIGQETLAQMPPQLGQLPELALMSTEAVARAGYRACLEGKTLEVPGALNKAVALFGQTQPRRFMRRLLGGASRWFGESG